MTQQAVLLIAKGKNEIAILPRMANRHGLIAGATGTGKTVTLRVMAEQFSRIGVPVFMADVKGDLSGHGQAGRRPARVNSTGESSSGSPTLPSTAAPPCSGMFSASRDIRSARPFPKWAPSSSRAS